MIYILEKAKLTSLDNGVNIEMKELNTIEEHLAYTRGFFDGEGCISRGVGPKTNRKGERVWRCRRKIVIANTEKIMLLDIQTWLEGIGINSQLFPRKGGKNKQVLWILSIGGYKNIET